MLSVTFNFYDTKEELPNKSGEYIVVTESNWTTRVPYSLKWGKFNVSDNDENDDTAIAVFYWAEVPNELKSAIRGKELIALKEEEDEEE